MKVSALCPALSSFIFEDIFHRYKYGFEKQKLWLMFLSTHSFQNLSPPWDLLFNLMSSLMPIFEKIYPMPGFCTPIWSICSSSLQNNQNICHSASGYFLPNYCAVAFDCDSDDLSYLQKLWHPSRHTCPLTP